jgi:hypothetical protein
MVDCGLVNGKRLLVLQLTFCVVTGGEFLDIPPAKTGKCL